MKSLRVVQRKEECVRREEKRVIEYLFDYPVCVGGEVFSTPAIGRLQLREERSPAFLVALLVEGASVVFAQSASQYVNFSLYTPGTVRGQRSKGLLVSLLKKRGYRAHQKKLNPALYTSVH